MPVFDLAFLKTMSNEGLVLENMAADPGKETYCGISRVWSSRFPGWAIIDASRTRVDFPYCLIQNCELQEMVKDWYYTEYWLPIGGDRIEDQIIAEELFDSCVNIGPVEKTFLQRVLNVLNYKTEEPQYFFSDLKVDGEIGDKTIKAMQLLCANGDQQHILRMLNSLQDTHYIALVEATPEKRQFMRGWDTRADS